MNKRILLCVASILLALMAVKEAVAQTYSNAVMALNPVAYWPLTETAQPPFGAYIATNIGTVGTAGNGFYQTWFQPLNTGTNTIYYQTNNIQHVAGAIGDSDTALNCTRSAAGAGGYVVFPRTTNGVPNSALTIKPPFSIEFWVKPSSVTSAVMPIINEGRVPVQQNAISGIASTNWTGFSIGQFGTIFFFATYNDRGADSTKTELDVNLTQNAWQHMVINFNGTNQTWFKNGVQAATKTIPASAANSFGQLYVPDITSPLLIGTGSIIGAGNSGTEYAGSIDEVAIYTNLLDSSAIANHFNAAASTDSTYKNTVLADNPAIYVRLGEPAFAESSYPSPATYPVATNYGVIGATGNGFYQPGTTPGVSGPPFTGFGPSSLAVAINGYSGAVDVGGGFLPPELNPTNKAAMTVAGWFQANPADAPARFQEIAGHGTASWRIDMDSTVAGARFNPGNNPELQFANLSDIATNGFLVNDSRWHFVAGVSDGTNDALYIDGLLAKTGTGVGAVAGTTLDALLGGDPNFLVPVFNGSATTQPRYFDGQIAHIAFFTNALSGVQIQQLYTVAGVPPYLWLSPQSQTNNAGANVTIAAGAHGSAPLFYQWYKNGAPVSSQTNASLAYTPAAVGDAGSYVLVATNNFGAVTSSPVTLFLFGAPVVQQQSLTDIRVFAGTSPTLRATVSGAQPITYQWTLGGSPIGNATNSTYTIVNAQTGGTYGCTIANFVGAASPAFNPVTLTVLPDPTAPYPTAVLSSSPAAYFRLDENPDNGTGNNGTTAYDNSGGFNAIYNNVLLGQPGYNPVTDPNDFAIELGDFPPNNDYAGNVPTYLNFGTTNGGNGEFSVEAWVDQLLFLNGGNCIVALGFGNGGEQFVLDTGGVSGALRFFVRNAAGATSAANSTTVIVNDNRWHHLVGVCDEAGGHVFLYVDGVLVGTGTITPGSGILSSSLPLVIGARESANNSPVSYDFQFIGQIDEVALYNRALSATEAQNHYFASGVAPLITQIQPANLTTNQGATVQFTVTAAGTGPLTYQWFDPNNALLSSTSNILILSNVQQSQGGTYTVVVSGSFGSPASTNANLTIDVGPPVITTDLQPINLTSYAGDPVTYSVIASGSTPMHFQWFQDGVAVNNATNSSFTLPALLGTNTYFVAVTNADSFNSFGGPTFSSTGTVVGVAVPTLSASNYTYNAKITFAGYSNRSETLRDFPVLVRFGSNISGFAYSQLAADGGDLRFTDATGTREIPHEIDEWNTNGISSVWVQVPRLSGTNDFIRAFWGNPAETTPLAWSTNGEVWVPQPFENLPAFQVVYHLKEAALPFADSTQLHPATNGVAPVPTNGIVGTGGDFGGISWLDVGTNDVGDAFTLSAWVNIPVGTANIQTIWANNGGGFAVPGLSLFVNSFQTTDQVIDFATGNGTTGNESKTGGGTVPFGSWHQVTVSVNRTNGTAQFYLDGNSAGTTALVVKDFLTVNDLNLGRFLGGSFDTHAQMDEARIQSGVNSTNWVWASWATVAQNSTFANYSSVASSIVTISFQLSGNNLILTWPEGTLQSAAEVVGPYNDVIGATSPDTNNINTAGPRQFYRVRIH